MDDQTGEKKPDFLKLHVYRLAEELADEIWKIVINWDSLARSTVGRQIVNCADSVGANIAEGTGRRSYADNRRFVRMARGSLYETRHFLRRARSRNLLKPGEIELLSKIIEELTPRLNAYLSSIGTKH